MPALTPLALALLLTAAGFAPPQARAITAYAWAESRLDPCASARTGDGLFGLTGELRRTVHAETAGCIAAADQVDFLRREWPLRYPRCATRFAAGDLAAFRRCWGRGKTR